MKKRNESHKILIVTSFFEEKIAYQEVQIAHVLARMGHQVAIITTNRENFNKETRITQENSNFPFKIFRLEKVLRIKSTFYPLQGLRYILKNYQPDYVFLIYPNLGLAYFFLKYVHPDSKVVSFFGDLKVTDKVGKASGTKGSTIIYKLLKYRWYRRVFERSDLIVSNTNETATILRDISKVGIDYKLLMPGLGYDSKQYYFDSELRKLYRKKFQADEDTIILVTVTRVYDGKPVDQWLDSVSNALKRNKKLRYIFAGFNNSRYSQYIKNRLVERGLPDGVSLLDFTSAKMNNCIFNCADYSVWFTPSISIQQSMGTGLPAIIPDDNTLNHLARGSVEGQPNVRFYSDFKELTESLYNLSPLKINKNKMSRMNHVFSYESILNNIISTI